MSSVLNRNAFLVKEHVGLFKSANNFDIYDPHTNERILECREERLGFFTQLLRFSDYKRYTPFDIEVREPDGTLHRCLLTSGGGASGVHGHSALVRKHDCYISHGELEIALRPAAPP